MSKLDIFIGPDFLNKIVELYCTWTLIFLKRMVRARARTHTHTPVSYTHLTLPTTAEV